jgi:hypothetical protein
MKHTDILLKDLISVKPGQMLIVWNEQDNKGVKRSHLEGPLQYYPEANDRCTAPLDLIIAPDRHYLKIQFLNGKKEISKGPTTMYCDPFVYKSITVEHCVEVLEGQSLVVFREEEGVIRRDKIEGPALWTPQPNEWQGQILKRFAADQHQYLEVKFKDGHKENIRG